MPPQQSTRRSIETLSALSLIATIAVAVFIFFPFSMSLVTVKTFVFAAGAIVTLALYILARLSRGNIIFPPLLFAGALWLPAIAYALSTVFSGVPFTGALWGSMLEPDTFGFILIAVSDSGVGIPEADKSKIFEKFFRGQNALKFAPDGTGLGLFISKSLLDAMGGKLDFVSKVGKGTTFNLYLPLTPR